MYDYRGTSEPAIAIDANSVAATEPAEGALPSPPEEKDLDSWQSQDVQMGYDIAVKAGLPVADVGAELSRRVIVRDVRRYKAIADGDTTYEFGVALRLTVTVYAAKLDARITLPIVAAQAQLGAWNAAADLRILGFTNNEVGDLLPRFDTLDVDSYGEYTKASDKIRTFISQHKADIRPTLLRTFVKPPAGEQRLTGAIGSTRALHFMERRRPLSEALEGLTKWPELEQAVRATYAEFMPDSDAAARPPEGVANKARSWLDWID